MPGFRESNQREGHPGAAPFGFVRTGRAFRQGSCPGEKALASMPMPPKGPDRPVLTAAQGTHARERALFEKPRAKN
jgi:hypothetical protein